MAAVETFNTKLPSSFTDTLMKESRGFTVPVQTLCLSPVRHSQYSTFVQENRLLGFDVVMCFSDIERYDITLL